METLVILLTIAVILLSVVIVALLVAVTLVLVKINRLAKDIQATTANLASASEWLSPVKVIGTIAQIFRK